MTDTRIAFSHANMRGSELRKPLVPVIPSPHPGGMMDIAFYAWPFSPEQEPTHIVAADEIQVWDDKGNSWMEPLGARHLAPMCRIEYDYLLSAESAAVFARFNLGRSTFKRVPVVKQDGTEIPGEWTYLHIGGRKDTLVPTQKDRMRPLDPIRTTVTGPMWIKENTLPVEASATFGVDLWRDPIWMDAIFMSAPLANALEVEGLAENWFLARCRWATDEDGAARIMTHNNDHSTPEYWLSMA